MRKIIIVLIVLLYGGSLFAIGGVADTVIIVGDSPATFLDRMKAAGDRLRSYLKIVEQVLLAKEIIVNQYKALESLGEGDFQAFADFFWYQTEVMNQFSDFMNDFDFYDRFEGLAKLDNFQERAGEIAASWSMANSLVQKVNNLVQNAKSRIRKMGNIFDQIKSGGGFVEQMQNIGEATVLVHSTLEDTLKVNMAAINLAEYHEQRREAEEELRKEETIEVVRNFFGNEEGKYDINTNNDYMITDPFESNVSQETCFNWMFGKYVEYPNK